LFFDTVAYIQIGVDHVQTFVSLERIIYITVAAYCGRFFIAFENYPTLGYRRVCFWDLATTPDGSYAIASYSLDVSVEGMLHCRFIDRDRAALLFTGDGDGTCIVHIYQYADGKPCSLSTSITVPVKDPTKIFTYNNKFSVVAYSPIGSNKMWTATVSANPRDGVVQTLPNQIYKVKVFYDNLFIFTDKWVQYTGDGTSWKVIYYPYASDGSEWTNIQVCSADNRIYIKGPTLYFYANIFGDDAKVLVKNTTIEHNAPLADGSMLEEFEIGEPVYLSGNVFKFNEETRLYETSTDATDCISSVKASGSIREYLGICSGVFHTGEKNIGQDTIEFSTHGDFYVRVDDSDQYELGDVILIDKSILGEDVVITGLIKRMIIGTITAKINKHYVSVMSN
jgi:hypothetical protein